LGSPPLSNSPGSRPRIVPPLGHPPGCPADTNALRVIAIRVAPPDNATVVIGVRRPRRAMNNYLHNYVVATLETLFMQINLSRNPTAPNAPGRICGTPGPPFLLLPRKAARSKRRKSRGTLLGGRGRSFAAQLPEQKAPERR
jgi:hypothetical protein